MRKYEQKLNAGQCTLTVDSLRRAKIVEAEAIFREVDIDNSGQLTGPKLKAVMKPGATGPPSPLKIRMVALLKAGGIDTEKQVFAQLDRNGDKAISRMEFLAAASCSQAAFWHSVSVIGRIRNFCHWW